MFRWFLASVALAATVASASAAFTVVVTPAIGPFYESPSYGTWQQNAINGLVAGGAGGGVAFGDATLPSYYAPGSSTIGPNGPVVPGGMINGISAPIGVGNLWQGQVNTPFTGEVGQWAYYGVSITGGAPGEFFSANDVTFNGYNYAGFPVNLGTDTLGAGASIPSPYLVGVPFGGGPLAPVTNATDPYQEMYYIGFGAGYVNNFPGDYTDQASLEAYFPDPLTPHDFLTGSYTVNSNIGVSNSNVGSLDINGTTPVPATVVFMGLGLAGLVTRFRRRNV